MGKMKMGEMGEKKWNIMGKTMSVNAAYSPGMTSFEYDEEESFPENLTEEALYYGKMDHG